MRNASMKVLKNLVCCAAFICLMFVLNARTRSFQGR